ncbi:dephospho-CoA kinase [Oharaeibacter diazotrophicus]|uniref:Dephospho-CoA kinase n=1 Tax=Oharaeibacter diazotrophicus TaxID=1920512 RepID=A0A4R6REZ6_9HYPH|nr:dephospho-CoA kinase [Oharaeibacter diazotrophicus]TDP84347.1 dephospho-CoA kinase [Oharaeibacter diazotrophicus]BBE73384.1 dephospho-CoA kinase [Pleomorphomonas sp. SM30]GLS75177.1 dephospho-CoA kinase [Oharaeibacter diazotrophicus]
MIVLGLTGSIGMGKSTTAEMFRARGVPVFDADATVHALYAGPLAAPVEAAFPGTTVNGAVDRAALGRRVLGDAEALRRLEAIVHPAVRAAERAFLEDARTAGATVAVLDIPLLYETGREADVDRVLVVGAAPEIQRARVLARPGMTAEKFEAILARQLPDAEKRRRADHVIDTGAGIAAAETAVDALLAELRR